MQLKISIIVDPVVSNVNKLSNSENQIFEKVDPLASNANMERWRTTAESTLYRKIRYHGNTLKASCLPQQRCGLRYTKKIKL